MLYVSWKPKNKESPTEEFTNLKITKNTVIAWGTLPWQHWRIDPSGSVLSSTSIKARPTNGSKDFESLENLHVPEGMTYEVRSPTGLLTLVNKP